MNSSLEYIKESGIKDNKHYLGRLSGIGAEFAKPTRNGRRYPLDLWRNIINSEDYKEAMSTMTCFGEVDHPEERADTSLKEVAIVLTNMDIRESEGIVKVDFDILDTPNGRLLKEILDYGSKIGVSTRGIGDEVVRNGETIIDPDSYVFYGFDAVVMPAVKSARPAMVESKKVKEKARSILETFNKEIEEATTVSELNTIKRIAESANLPNIDSINESIDIKINSFEGEDISAKLLKDLGELSKENEELKVQLNENKSSEIADDIGIMKIEESLINRTKDIKRLNKLLRTEKNNNEKIYKNYNSLLNKQFKGAQKTKNITEEYNKLVKDHEELRKGSSKMLKSIKNLKTETTNKDYKLKLTEDKMISYDISYQAQLKKATEEIKELKIKENNLLKETMKQKRINDQLADLNVELTETNNKIVTTNLIIPKLQDKIGLLENEIETIKNQKKLVESNLKNICDKEEVELKQTTILLEKTLTNYLDVRCKQHNVDQETVKGLLPKNYTTEDIDKIVNTLSDRARRLNKVPFMIQSKTVTLNESIGLNEEDRQTLSFLKGSI